MKIISLTKAYKAPWDKHNQRGERPLLYSHYKSSHQMGFMSKCVCVGGRGVK